MNGLSKRQQKAVEKGLKLEQKAHSSSRYIPTSKEKPRSKVNYLIHLFWIVVIAAAALWLKSNEGWYNELFDPYKILNVPKTASIATIKQQFRKLSLEWHPDKRPNCDNECKDTFEKISLAHKILSNPNRRQLYDTTAKVMVKPTSSFASDMHPYEYSFSPEVWDNIVKPSVEGKQLGMANHISGVWVVFVGNGRSSTVTEHIIPLWSDLAAKFYGRVSFLRIDADEYPDFESRMPFRIRVKPAFFMMSPVEAPLFFTDMSRFSPHVLSEWITENMPNTLVPWTGDEEALAKYITGDVGHEGNNLYKIPVAVISNKLPCTLIKAAAIKSESTIEWIQPQSSRFMEFLGPHVRQQLVNIKDGAAIVSTVNGEPFARIIGSPAYRLDARTRERAMEDISKTTAGKYLKFVTQLTKKIIGGNSVPGFRENYLYLCGASDEKAADLSPWAEERNVTVQSVILPPNHKTSQLSRMLYREGTDSVLVQLKEEKLAPVAANGTVGEWQVTMNHQKYFPRYKKNAYEMTWAWLIAHPYLTGLIMTSTIASVYGLKWLISLWREHSAA